MLLLQVGEEAGTDLFEGVKPADSLGQAKILSHVEYLGWAKWHHSLPTGAHKGWALGACLAELSGRTHTPVSEQG